MVREYSQYGYERAREGRDYRQDSEYYGGGDYDQQSQNERAPLEWDDRRYGQDFNQSPRQGGRSVYASGSDRGRQNFNQNSNEFGAGRSGGSTAGRSSRGGGRDYESNDYHRNDRMQGSGEWNSQSNRQNGRGDDSDYGSEFYGKGSGFRTAQGSGMSTGNYEDQNYGRAWDQYYGTRNPESFDGEQTYGSQSGGYGRAFSGRSYGDPSYGGQSYSGQSYKGSGPKGYQRSDDRIKEIVCEVLTDAPHIDASDINVEVKNREIKLTGTVRDRRTKYAAEELIERRAGSCEIHNEIRVKSGSENQSLQQRSGGDYGYSQSAARGATMHNAEGTSQYAGSSSGQIGNQGKQEQSGKSDGGRTSDKTKQ